jgi:hypothetical protein
MKKNSQIVENQHTLNFILTKQHLHEISKSQLLTQIRLNAVKQYFQKVLFWESNFLATILTKYPTE